MALIRVVQRLRGADTKILPKGSQFDITRFYQVMVNGEADSLIPIENEKYHTYSE